MRRRLYRRWAKRFATQAVVSVGFAQPGALVFCRFPDCIHVAAYTDKPRADLEALAHARDAHGIIP